jgi:hypothetical protein
VYLNVAVWDEVRKSKKDKPIGSSSFELGDVLGSRGNIKAKRLKNGGTLFMRVKHATNSKTLHVPSMVGKKLANVDGFFGRSDPFFEIASQQDGPGGKHWNTVYRSTHIKNNLNPQWEAFQLDLDKVQQDDDNSENGSGSPIRITIYDHESSGKHEFMGSFETTISALLGSEAIFSVLSKKGKPKGTIEIKHATIQDDGAVRPPSVPGGSSVAPPPHTPFSRPPSFFDYISGSCELNMSVAIDFTGSNGDPRRHGTLHYIHPDGGLNDYEKALTAVGDIISKYDSDQKYPVYGFGAKLNGQLHHCFQCGGTNEVSGVSGIIQAYRSTFHEQIILSGPTLFQEVIQTAAANASSAQEKAKCEGRQSYSVLLIVTDGAVSDMNATKNALMAASNSPLSVVIVGVGNADFSAMQFLDDFRASPPSNDIAQFVEFRRHAHDKRSLTEATLEEIPDQLVNYFVSRNIFPSPLVSNLNVKAEPYNEDVDIDLTLDFHGGNSNDDIEIDMSSGAAPAVYDYRSYGAATQYLESVPPQPTNPSASPMSGGGGGGGETPVAAPMQQPVPPPPTNPSAPPMSFRGGGGETPVAAPNQQPVPPPPTNPSAPPTNFRVGGGGATPVAAPNQQPVPPPPTNPRAPPTGFRGGGGETPVAAPNQQPQMSSIFRVQVPAGVYPGQQLQVLNPHTGQTVLVAVPHGVAPGGTFNAR